MPNLPHQEAITTIAQATIIGEQTAELAIRDIAELVAHTTEQAAIVKLPPFATQPAMEHLQVAMNAAFDTRRAVVAAHQEFGVLAKRLGASPESYGDFWPCPPFPRGEEHPKRTGLKSVA